MKLEKSSIPLNENRFQRYERVRFWLPKYTKKLHKRREGKGGKDHVIEVRHSCTRRTAMCTRINKNKNDGDRLFWLSLKAAHKSHVTLHVKSNAEKVNSPIYLRSLIKLSHNYPYSFRQVVVVTSTLASLQRKRGISNKTAGSPGRTERSLQHCWSCSYIWMWIQQEEDVSSFGVGGRFLQDDQPVAFDSNTLQVTEQFSAVTGKESLAVYLGFNLSL